LGRSRHAAFQDRALILITPVLAQLGAATPVRRALSPPVFARARTSILSHAFRIALMATEFSTGRFPIHGATGTWVMAESTSMDQQRDPVVWQRPSVT
jgi:hypothetical protein